MSRINPLLIAAFPILLVIFALTYFLLPASAELVLFPALPLYAVFATVLASRVFRRDRSTRSGVLLGLAALTWLLWAILPIKRIGGLARLYVEMPTYEASAAKDEQVLLRPCSGPDSCAPGSFRYFPYTSGLFLLPTLGVVRTPHRTSNLDERALHEQLGQIDCEPEPLAKGYFWCSAP